MNEFDLEITLTNSLSNIKTSIIPIIEENRSMYLALKSLKEFCLNFQGRDLASLAAQIEFAKVIEKAKHCLENRSKRTSEVQS